MTRGDDSGVAVLRSALESFGIDAGDEEALRASCHVTNEGVSIDDLEDVANKRGLDAEQQMAPPHELLDPANLPSIVVVDTEHGTDFWLLWRRDGESILVMDPRLGDEWRSTTLVEGRLHVHEMTVPVSPEALAAHSAVGVSDGGVQLRGGVFVALRKRKR